MKKRSGKNNYPESPKSAEDWEALAHHLAQNSHWPECEKACLEGLELQSDNLNLIELMTTACLQNEHLDAAEHLAQTLLHRAPLDPFYRMGYAKILQKQEKLGEAQRELLRLQPDKLPVAFANEIEAAVQFLDHMQLQQLMALLDHNVELRSALARNPHAELQNLGFHFTESMIETVQTLLWEQYDQPPFHAPEVPEQVPRVH